MYGRDITYGRNGYGFISVLILRSGKSNATDCRIYGVGTLTGSFQLQKSFFSYSISCSISIQNIIQKRFILKDNIKNDINLLIFKRNLCSIAPSMASFVAREQYFSSAGSQ